MLLVFSQLRRLDLIQVLVSVRQKDYIYELQNERFQKLKYKNLMKRILRLVL